MATDVFVTKGTRVQYGFYRTTDACLAGCQPKVGAVAVSGVGTVTHVYGDAPVNPTRIWYIVQPDSGGPEIEVPQAGVKAVIVDGPVGQA